jgi:predicted negative regulator of RcsB-dependent stress response
MAYDLEEQEQIDALKAWWKDNGRLVILAIIAAAVAAGAVSGWRWYNQRQTQQASQLYSSLEKAVRSSDAAQVKALSAQVVAEYPRTVFASMAALVAAKVNFDAGDLAGAASQLEWTVANARDDETKAVAQLRLAAVRLDEKQYDQALALLGRKAPEAFDSLYADLRGDVLVAQGKLPEARAAYKQAIEKLPVESTFRMLVQAKLDGIGGGS